MQISASTLLAQQASRVAPKAPQPADAFEPLRFKQTAKAPEMQVAAPTKPATSASAGLSSGPSTAYVRPGTNIDIKV